MIFSLLVSIFRRRVIFFILSFHLGSIYLVFSVSVVMCTACRICLVRFVVVVVVVVVLTLTHNTMQSVVAGQAPIRIIL